MRILKLALIIEKDTLTVHSVVNLKQICNRLAGYNPKNLCWCKGTRKETTLIGEGMNSVIKYVYK